MSEKDLMTIRRMEMKDTESITALCNQLGYQSTESDIEERFRPIQNDSNQAVFVSENLDDQVIGWIHVKISFSLTIDLSAEMWAKSKGFSSLHFISRKSRERAHELYKTLGFEVVKESYYFNKKLSDNAEI